MSDNKNTPWSVVQVGEDERILDSHGNVIYCNETYYPSYMDRQTMEGIVKAVNDCAALKAQADAMAEALEAWARVETGSSLWKDEAVAKREAVQALTAYRAGKPIEGE